MRLPPGVPRYVSVSVPFTVRTALQLPELEALDRAGQIAEALQELDVRPVLQRLGGLIVDDRYLPRLRHALARPLHHRLVDPLLDDLVPDVVRAVHVEPLLVEAEPDREGGVLDEDEVRTLIARLKGQAPRMM
jgi:hypothetical protein